MKSCGPIALVAAMVLAAGATPGAHAAAPEVRGVWLTTTGPNHIQSGANTPAVMADLRTIGLNTAYVETWKNGYTNYPSPRLAGITGGVDRSTFLGTRDLVQETLIHAHRNQMAYVGWFEYGFAAQFIGSGGTPSNPLANYMKNQGWLLQNQTGQYGDATNGYAWMNPAVPQVRQLLIDLTLEAVNRYDLDGIQFDDRLSWPVQFGFDATTLSMYTAETGQPAPTSPTSTSFRQWRQSKVTQFATELYTAVKAARPELVVSVAPSITTFSTTNYNADWPAWQNLGLFDEYAIQAYRDNLGAFNSIVNAQVDPFEPDDLDQLVIGLRINGSGVTTPYADLQAMIERTRAEGAAGHSLWYSAGVRDLYAAELTAFYDVAGQGHAPNPRFASDHRPAPVVAMLEAGSTNRWSLDVSAAGRYRVVAKEGSYWTELAAIDLAAGQYLLTIPGVTQLELLADRRSATSFLGDFNADAAVDGADFLAWQRGLGRTSPLPSHGDANRDGKVNARDLLAWRLNAGLELPGGAALAVRIPEPAPAMLAALACLMLAAARRLRAATCALRAACSPA